MNKERKTRGRSGEYVAPKLGGTVMIRVNRTNISTFEELLKVIPDGAMLSTFVSELLFLGLDAYKKGKRQKVEIKHIISVVEVEEND